MNVDGSPVVPAHAHAAARRTRTPRGTLRGVCGDLGRRRAAALVAVGSLLLGGCWWQDAPASADVVEVGTGPAAESVLLAELVAALARAAELPAEVVELADDDDARRALEVGDVDVLPSYSGEAWLRVLGRGDPPSDQGTSLARVREFDERSGLLWLRPTVARDQSITAPPADATFALVVQAGDEAPASVAEVATLSQLAALLPQLEDPALCIDPEFAEREDGWSVVRQAYSIGDAVRVIGVGPAEAVLGVADGACVAGLTAATDGAAWLAEQRPLVDDLEVFPAFVVVPVVRRASLARYEGLGEALGPMLTGLTTARLGTWNARVAAGEDPSAVAADAAVELLDVTG